MGCRDGERPLGYGAWGAIAQRARELSRGDGLPRARPDRCVRLHGLLHSALAHSNAEAVNPRFDRLNHESLKAILVENGLGIAYPARERHSAGLPKCGKTVTTKHQTSSA